MENKRKNIGSQVGGGELSHYKKERGAYWKFWKEPLRVTKILICGCDFHPYEVQISKQNIISSHFSLAQYLKGTAKAPAVGFFRLNTLRGTKNTFLTPKLDEHPMLFIRESLPHPPGAR